MMRTLFSGFVGLLICGGMLISPIWGQTIESLSFGGLLHFGTNVPDAFKPIKAAETNLNGKVADAALGALQVLQFGYKSSDNGHMTTAEITAVVQQYVAEQAAIAPAVIGQALFYPNPARQMEKPNLGYQLSKNMDIEIQMYDMMANRIFRNTFLAGTNGGKEGYNRLTLNLDTFSGHFLSAGVYFYLIIHNGHILAKGKVAVIP